jgi:hypothetical protein
MTDAERIARLEAVLSSLIAWLHREIGTPGTVWLLDRLAEPTPQESNND